VFAGCSMGGYTMFELWRQAPGLIAGMVLCDTRAEPDTDESRAKRSEQIRMIRERGPDFMQYFVAQNLLSETTRTEQPGVVVRVKELVSQAPAETMVATLQALADRADSGPTLASINVPTLVVVGENDTVTPLAASERLRKDIPGAELQVIPGAGHLTPLEKPDEINALLGRFVKRLQP
jgi:3-oxoadipate enol-lactonase